VNFLDRTATERSSERTRQVRGVFVFYDDDMPSPPTHELQHNHGYSVYRGVLVQWDEDQDGRVLTFVDSLNHTETENLAMVQEHEGAIILRWKWHVPEKYQTDSMVDVEGDKWSVQSDVLGSFDDLI
jgi:hypothetical protein